MCIIQTLKLWLEKNKDTAAAEETADTEELMDILRETTDALVQEIKEVENPIEMVLVYSNTGHFVLLVEWCFFVLVFNCGHSNRIWIVIIIK